MITAAVQIEGLDPVEVFAERCDARAFLVAFGLLDLHEAVDKLQADAAAHGLIDLIGQDAVQFLMSTAFAEARA